MESGSSAVRHPPYEDMCPPASCPSQAASWHHVEPYIDAKVKKMYIGHAMTPSSGYLSPSSVQSYSWICHMCRKKCLSIKLLSDHVLTKGHQRKALWTWTLEEWVNYNMSSGFYEVPETQASAQSLQDVHRLHPLQAMPLREPPEWQLCQFPVVHSTSQPHQPSSWQNSSETFEC